MILGFPWIRVFYHNTDGGLFSSPEDALSKNMDNPTAELYSILGQLEDYQSGGIFHFKLCYPELVGVNDGDGCNEWMQTSNPATESTITGFQPISLSFPYNSYLQNWVGIGKDISGHGATFIDDAPNEINWYTAIGSYKYWGEQGATTIPGPRGENAVKKVELYVNPVVCQEGWEYFDHTKSCYKRFTDSSSVNWMDAQYDCRQHGVSF